MSPAFRIQHRLCERWLWRKATEPKLFKAFKPVFFLFIGNFQLPLEVNDAKGKLIMAFPIPTTAALLNAFSTTGFASSFNSCAFLCDSPDFLLFLLLRCFHFKF